jgi:hypothetical protein
MSLLLSCSDLKKDMDPIPEPLCFTYLEYREKDRVKNLSTSECYT